MNNRFCCLDVINSITIASPNKQIVNTYLNNEIHKGFKDQKIWSGYTNYKKKDRIVFKREYNRNILDWELRLINQFYQNLWRRLLSKIILKNMEGDQTGKHKHNLKEIIWNLLK